jgi:DNA-binding CsgD family transcriptional regulator
LPPAQSEDYDRNLTAVRNALDETTFAAAWSDGGAMPLEAVVEYALVADQSDGPATAGAGATPAATALSARQPATLPAGLSAREVEVLRLLAGGRTSKEIAAQLVLSAHTVERHIANLYAKIGARRRAHGQQPSEATDTEPGHHYARTRRKPARRTAIGLLAALAVTVGSMAVPLAGAAQAGGLNGGVVEQGGSGSPDFETAGRKPSVGVGTIETTGRKPGVGVGSGM